jgi:nicotinate dehydrogenase subunit B
VNPDGLRNQVEGCIVHPILRFAEAPKVEVILVNRPDQPLLGAGEAATAPVPAALTEKDHVYGAR